MKKNLKIAAMINIIVGGLFTLLGFDSEFNFLFNYGLFELVIGFIYASFSEQNTLELYKNRGWLLTLAIINLLPNFLSSIFCFIAHDNIIMEYRKNKDSLKEEPKEIREKRKLDALLKIGVGLVFLSGIIFVNSSVFALSNWLKFGFMAFITTIFYLLYLFSDEYLKIESTTNGYYYLSEFFGLLSFYSIGAYGLLGNWFSFNGGGSSLVEMSLFAVFAAIMYINYKKFKKNNYLYFTYFGCLLALISFLEFCGVSDYMSLTCLSLISLLISMLEIESASVKKVFMNFLLSATYFLAFAYFYGGATIEQTTDQIMLIFSGVLLLANMYLFTVTNKEKWSAILTTVFSMPILPYMVSRLNLPVNINVWVLTLSYTTIFGILLLNKEMMKNKLFYNLTTIALNLALFSVYIYSYQVSTALALMVSFALLFVNFMYLSVFGHTKTLEYYTQPVKTSILIFTCLKAFGPNINFSVPTIFTVMSALLLLVTLFRLEKDLKWSYFVTYLGVVGIAFISNIVSINVFSSCVLPLLSGYTAYLTYNHEDKKMKSLYPLSYGFTLLMVYSFMSSMNVFDFQPILNDILVLLVFIGGMVINYKDKKLFIFSIIASMLPVYHLFNLLFPSDLADTIFINFIAIGVTLWFSETGIKQEKDRDIFSSVMIGFIILRVLFHSNIVIGVYVGVVTLILMLITLYREYYHYLFKLSVFIFIVNIIFRLRDFWKEIPAWAYLLICGIGLIGLVTYKEIKKAKVNSDEVS